MSAPVPRGAGLRTYHLVALLITAHAPLTLLWAVVPTALQNGKVVATPLIFALAGLILLGFVLGYSGLARRVRHPGGLYVQVVRGLGRPVGLGAAAVTLLAYTGLVAGLYGFFATVFVALVDSLFGVVLPAAVGLLLCVVSVLALGVVPLRIVVRLLLGVVVGQIAVVLAFDLGAFTEAAGSEVSFTPLDPGWILSGSFGVALVFAVTAFVGSEAGATYSDELTDPQRAIPKATYISYAVTTAVLVVSAWAVSVAVGPEQAPLQAAALGAAFLPAVVASIVGAGAAGTVTNLLLGVLLVGLLATGVTLHNATSRQLAGLARDGVLPAPLAIPRLGGAPPWRTALIQPVVAGLIALFALFSEQKVLPLWLVVGSGLAATGVLTLASAATVVWFLRGVADEDGFFGWEGQVVAGFFSIVTTGFIFLYGVTRVREIAPGSPPVAAWLVGVLIGGVFGTGVVVALVLQATRPAAYATIGQDQAQATGRTPAEPPPTAGTIPVRRHPPAGAAPTRVPSHAAAPPNRRGTGAPFDGQPAAPDPSWPEDARYRYPSR
ncbi:APC family permease [Cryptosporangium minutisporangium]|uniref:APC family permease n=1 Tax=Cryptosporangium minutisporangium TaxID=113569 RepID=A0ABP6SRR7_9ACTN